MSIHEYLSEAETAEKLGVKIGTLRVWSVRRFGPARTKVGRKILYRESSLVDWLRRQEVDPGAARQTVGR